MNKAKRYKLPEWRYSEYYKTIESIVENPIHDFAYSIEEGACCYLLLLVWQGRSPHISKIGSYLTVDEAKEAAEEHYNQLVHGTIIALTQHED